MSKIELHLRKEFTGKIIQVSNDPYDREQHALIDILVEGQKCQLLVTQRQREENGLKAGKDFSWIKWKNPVLDFIFNPIQDVTPKIPQGLKRELLIRKKIIAHMVSPSRETNQLDPFTQSIYDLLGSDFFHDHKLEERCPYPGENRSTTPQFEIFDQIAKLTRDGYLIIRENQTLEATKKLLNSSGV